MTAPLPPLPDPNAFAYEAVDGDVLFQAEAYQRALCAYWEARARVAVGALQNIKDRERFDEDGIWHPMCGAEEYVERAEVALASIGDLPAAGEQS